MRTVGRFLAGVVLAAVLAAAGAALYVRHWLDAPLTIGAEALLVDIQRGEPMRSVANELAQRGVLEHPRWLSLYASATKADARIRAGEYAVQPGTTPRMLMLLFISGAV